jgi:small-conductance mechanosensitive channel
MEAIMKTFVFVSILLASPFSAKLQAQHSVSQSNNAKDSPVIHNQDPMQADHNQKIQRAQDSIEDTVLLPNQTGMQQTEQHEKTGILQALPVGYPVDPFKDTLFMVYSKIGPVKPGERANNISDRIRSIYYTGYFKTDSLKIVPSDENYDITYQDIIIMSVSDRDAYWNQSSKEELAEEIAGKIRTAINHEKRRYGFVRTIGRIGLTLAILAALYFLVIFFNSIFRKLDLWLKTNKDVYFKGITIKNYRFLSGEQVLAVVLRISIIIKWMIIVLIIYLSLPAIFSLFPFTRNYAYELLSLIWLPFKRIILSIVSYLPSLITVLIIFFLTRYAIRFLKFLAREIEDEKLKIPGFHPDWAMPTYSIARFFMYAFMFVVIFPYLPGSDSPIFKGVSVFLGILFSLGSSSAISNMIAGLVITYMRPFKIGDRIKIGDITGDVMEKNLLVTRIKTIKNEEITIPNASILSGHTINFSTSARENGLIIHTTVTIGYNTPWRTIHQLLIDAASSIEMVEKKPEPFVLQTRLDDYYVHYQINAYTKEPGKQAIIYSMLHQAIQDSFNAAGVEIMSPHYSALREGNQIAIPADQIPDHYTAPSFRFKQTKSEK